MNLSVGMYFLNQCSSQLMPLYSYSADERPYLMALNEYNYKMPNKVDSEIKRMALLSCHILV